MGSLVHDGPDRIRAWTQPSQGTHSEELAEFCEPLLEYGNIEEKCHAAEGEISSIG